jgi:hypothetical protein
LRFEQTGGETEETEREKDLRERQRERERERGIAEEDTCRGDRCTYMYVCTDAAAQVFGVNCLLHRSRTGKFAMAGCSKSFMNLIGGACSSSDHHQTRQDKTRSGGEIAAQRRLFLIKVAGGKRKNTEIDIIGLTYLPEAASTNTTTTTTTTRSRLQVCVCVVCVCSNLLLLQNS